MNNKIIYGIYDTFHESINKGKTPLVTSAMFESDHDFFNWCSQHGAKNKWFKIKRKGK